MTTTRYTITDTAGTSGSVTVTADDIATAITPWYPDAPAEVYAQVQALQDALTRGEYTEADQYLGVRVDPAA